MNVPNLQVTIQW